MSMMSILSFYSIVITKTTSLVVIYIFHRCIYAGIYVFMCLQLSTFDHQTNHSASRIYMLSSYSRVDLKLHATNYERTHTQEMLMI